MLENMKCEVVDLAYAPMPSRSARDALHLYLRGKAVILTEHPDMTVNTSQDMFPVPTQIRLNRVVPMKRGNALLTQRNLFVRDKYTCQYCNRHKSELSHGEFLTRDHIHPQSRGGLDTWLNVVTSCNHCNNRKADSMPDEVKMHPTHEPKIPTIFELRSKANHGKKKK